MSAPYYIDLVDLPASRPQGFPHVFGPEALANLIQKPHNVTPLVHMADAVATLLFQLDPSGQAMTAFMNIGAVQNFLLDHIQTDHERFNLVVSRRGKSVEVRVFRSSFSSRRGRYFGY